MWLETILPLSAAVAFSTGIVFLEWRLRRFIKRRFRLPWSKSLKTSAESGWVRTDQTEI